MQSLDRFAEAKLAQLDHQHLRRTLVETGRGDFPYVRRGGRRLISFSCNDYLGLSVHPRVKAAAMAATEAHGAGAGASRLVTGNHPLHAALEARLARLKGTEAAALFGSGYLANIGALGVLAGPEDLIVIDELAHSCLNSGARLAGARVVRFPHNDVAAAEALLAAHRHAVRHALIVTETVFSMDGDLGPIDDLSTIAARHDAWLVTDDAHGLAVVPESGCPVAIQMGTLSKALGSYGGYLCASAPVVALMKTRARSLVYSTALPAACVAAALAALDVMADEPERAARPLAKARLFTETLALPPAESPIVPLVLGAPETALAASAQLEAAGFLVTAIRPPTVPPGTARLRFAFSAAHEDAWITRLATILMDLPALKIERSECLASS